MSYWQLVIKHPRTLAFGFLTAFFSGLGQTHFIALLSPSVMLSYNLTHSDYGSIYSFVTLVSGFFISFLGPAIDRYDIRKVSVLVGLGLVISQMLLLSQENLLFVALGLFGLRLFGQGMCSSISSISIARFFNQERGKALSISSLGYPIFEGLMTPAFAFMIIALSFKSTSAILIFTVLLLFIPLVWTLTRKIPDFNLQIFTTEDKNKSDSSSTKDWSRKDVLRHPKFYLILPQVLMPPFALTGLFFHQAALADIKSLSLPLMATGLSFFALGRILNSFVTGPQVDRYTAIKLFPFYQIPMALGLLTLALFDQAWSVLLGYFLFGLTVGSGGTIKSAIWAELYGVRHLGAIKSSIATIMVLSTSLSPALFGYYFDFYKDDFALMISLSLLTVFSSILSFFVLKK